MGCIGSVPMELFISQVLVHTERLRQLYVSRTVLVLILNSSYAIQFITIAVEDNLTHRIHRKVRHGAACDSKILH